VTTVVIFSVLLESLFAISRRGSDSFLDPLFLKLLVTILVIFSDNVS
jgi:hypothetical protein